MRELRHVSTVAIGGYAVLIGGPSGAGKSDLALRLIDRGAVLVSDDYTVLTAEAGVLIASAPPTIAGKLEVRGLGIVSMPYASRAPVALSILLGPETERMPVEGTMCRIADISLPELIIDPLAPSAPIKVEWALRGITG